jgi:hypothetical protein
MWSGWRRAWATLLPLVRAGTKFVDGIQQQTPNTTQLTETAPWGSRLIMLGRSTTFDNYSRLSQ